MTLNFKLLYLGMVVISGVLGRTQGEPAQSRATGGQHAAMDDLAFMSGRWKGEMEGASMTEEWSAPEGDSMMGMFRVVKNRKPTFYEFLVIERTNGVPVLKLKHFNAGLIGWEEKDKVYEYPLLTLENHRAVFERPDRASRLTYESPSPTSLTATLERTVAGKKTIEEFHFIRNH